MERNIPSLLLIHLVFFVLPAPPFVATSGLTISRVVHVSHRSSWSAAQNYCRTYHSDLVTIRNGQEAKQLALYEGWIGLYLGSDYEWKWSRGDEIASFTVWDFDEPEDDECCALQSDLKWEGHNCSHPHSFLCIDERLILVQEMKTWEEALLHCRELQAVGPTAALTTHLYDLASLPEACNALLDRETKKLNAATNEVWVGLRFLAGEWLWVNRQAVTSSYLPHCPAQQQHCGALDHNKMHWKIMKCTEKRNFFCSINL